MKEYNVQGTHISTRKSYYYIVISFESIYRVNMQIYAFVIKKMKSMC